MSDIIPSSGLTVVTPKLGSLRLFYQKPGGPIGQLVEVDKVWTQDSPKFNAVPLTPLASISWDNGDQIRVYYLDSQYLLQEYCYTKGKNWYPGKAGEAKIKASPVTRLSAIVYNDAQGRHIRVYYQGYGSRNLRELCHDAGKWHDGEMVIHDAVEGTGLAAVTYAGGGFIQIRVYYQTFEGLYLKEYCHNNKGWLPGQFSPGKAPLGATIGAIANDNAKIHVFWRDYNGRISHSKHTDRWEPTRVIRDVDPGFRFAVLQWEAGKLLRIFSEDYVENILSEYRSDNGGETWTEKKLTGSVY